MGDCLSISITQDVRRTNVRTVRIFGHGATPHSGAYIPVGMSITRWADDGVDLPTGFAAKIIVDENYSQSYTDTGTADGTPIANRRYSRASGEEALEMKRLAKKSGRELICIGDSDWSGPVALCATPEVCGTEHKCGGLLQKLQDKGYTDVKILACQPNVSGSYGAGHKGELQQTAQMKEQKDLKEKLLGMLKEGDYTGAESVWNEFDDVTQSSLFLNFRVIRSWRYWKATTEIIEGEGDEVFYPMYYNPDIISQGVSEYYGEHDDLLDAIARYEQKILAYLERVRANSWEPLEGVLDYWQGLPEAGRLALVDEFSDDERLAWWLEYVAADPSQSDDETSSDIAIQ